MHRYIRTQRPVIRLRWAGCGALHADGLHLAPSVSKSFAGTLAAMLVSEGAPDPSAPVSRHFDETHADLDAVVWKFARADVLFPRPAGYAGPLNLQVRIWSRLGAEQDALYRGGSAGASRENFAKAGYRTLPGWSDHNQWWNSPDDHGLYMARGVHGQAIYIDPTSLPAYRALAGYLMQRGRAAELRSRTPSNTAVAIRVSRDRLRFRLRGAAQGFAARVRSCTNRTCPDTQKAPWKGPLQVSRRPAVQGPLPAQSISRGNGWRT